VSENSIVQNLISQLGQSQEDRNSPELDPEFFRIDPRSPADLLAQARDQAALMRYYVEDPDISTGDWAGFFPTPDKGAALLESGGGEVAPHLGLLGSFFELYREPQTSLNGFTARHMDFQFRRVLHFQPGAARPDHAHLIVEAKKGVAPFAITADQAFSAGKDATGVELLYKPVRDVVIGPGKVEALCSVRRDDSRVTFAPIANSSDGLGGVLENAQPKWPPFGGDALPAAPIGFALASPVLRMQEGSRKVNIELTLGGIDAILHTASRFASAFQPFLTGPKGWLGPFNTSAVLQNHGPTHRLTLTFSLQPTDPAVVDYQSAIHAQALSAQAPVAQLILQPGAELRYADLESLSISVARITVEVNGVKNLVLENDNGGLNPKKAFQPFGPQPVVGSRFMIGCEEALSKSLTDLHIDLTWLAPPPNLQTLYADYSQKNRLSNGITARMVYQDRSGQISSAALDDILMRNPLGVTRLSPSAPPVGKAQGKNDFADRGLFALLFSGSGFGRALGRRRKLAHPMWNRNVVPAPSPRNGFVTVALEVDFLHADFRKETIKHALAQDGIQLNEPYTPTVQDISLGYSAASDEVDMSLIGDAGEASFTNLDLRFFHVGCFGQAPEHAFLRVQIDEVADKVARLMPQYPNAGELLIGLSGVAAGDSVSLLLQVAEGSADPSLHAQPIHWSVLCDNYWHALTPRELVLDTTLNLLASGIVALTLPKETSLEHTWMPTGRVWLRASVQSDGSAACQLIDVSTNAVEVVFADQGNDTKHLTAPLSAGSIAKLKAPQAGLKKVSQPYAGFGGRPVESPEALTRRASERLRHRHRCIAPWDYERMLLEAFPALHKVKCIPHASETSWLAPGNVMLIAIPDLRNQNAVDPLAPRVDLATLTRMTDYAQRYCGMQVKIVVKNARYRPVRLDFKVRFRPGYPFNFYSGQLDQALIQALSPWAFGAARPIEFGGRINRSVLLDFVEKLPYVDFVTEFRMGALETTGVFRDVPELAADAPDTILVSDTHHTIVEVSD
jgi:hypothetical protein